MLAGTQEMFLSFGGCHAFNIQYTINVISAYCEFDSCGSGQVYSD